MIGERRRMLGLDIGEYAIKAVELTMEGKNFALSGYGDARITSQDRVKDALREALSSGNISSKRAATAVSGRGVIVRYITLRRMSPSELKNSIRYEAARYIPFEMDQVALDCQKIDEGEEEGKPNMKVLVAAVKKSLIQEHIDVVRSAGLEPVVIDVDAFALGNAFLTWGSPLTSGTDDKALALVDIGGRKTNINIIMGGSSHFTREIYLGGTDFSVAIGKRLSLDPESVDQLKISPGERAAEVAEALLEPLADLGREIRLSFDYFETQSEREVGQVLLSGGGALLAGVAEGLQEVLGRPTTLWDPTQGVTLKLSERQASRVRENAPRLAIALGLAVRLRGKL
ncbi:MAG: hypothetical protein AMS15_01425 [Planctomycetes bacterium DG_23]|nr:MAG: hypothetical protein AMS15_01425 [Planctomycetes bacterium DG_23]